MDRGVRQGCPISPLLFAAAVDVLLRILQKRLPESTIRAFADDIGAVVTDLPAALEVLERSFAEFKDMSGLELNIGKTVCIPLWEKGMTEVPQILQNTAWSNLSVATHATYLGFVQGPGKESKSWEKAMAKYLSRCNLWKIWERVNFSPPQLTIHLLPRSFHTLHNSNPPPRRSSRQRLWGSCA